jgi:hypothetical protein
LSFFKEIGREREDMVLGEGRWLVLSIIVGNFYEYV